MIDSGDIQGLHLDKANESCTKSMLNRSYFPISILANEIPASVSFSEVDFHRGRTKHSDGTPPSCYG